MDAAVRPHLLAANNVFLGPINFLILPLPEGWEVRNGISRPEVDSTEHWAGAAWARGRAYYLLVHPARRLGLELWLEAAPGTAALPPDATRLRLQAHEEDGAYRFSERQLGLLGRRREPQLELRLNCPHTKRRITLTLSGPCAPEEWQQLLAAFATLRCH
ncbi:hypothetical protein [Kallotenue papyrolyticum]|uniref:hypothetical protein n=1 Tax=Kallotenue papyrolyticum TaxID=1325125 RepID=UPI0004924D60|nr:hypothetical protein [Kallotenue papyrolyticum]